MDSAMKGKLFCAVAVAGLIATSAAADTIELTGVVRDFKRGDWQGGHPDFETAHLPGRGGFGHVPGLVTMGLSEDHKPVYNPVRPDQDTVYSADSFAQWYRDVKDVNLSVPLTIELSNGKDTSGGVYTYATNNFWPIDDKLYGNQQLDHNFHFTYELHTAFTYVPGQRFTFVGDDDVWVYVNGVKVIDLGGVHPAITGSVLLFDGKAFLADTYPTTDEVKVVDKQMATQMTNFWQNIGFTDPCPIKEGGKYIDLYLTEGTADTRAEFNSTSVTCYSTKDLSNVVLHFEDGSEQKFEGLTGTSGTFQGTGEYEGKTIIGVWIKAGNNKSGEGPGKGHYSSSDGSTSIECNLDFFFAERHTTQSNFRIDTSMPLESVPGETVSALYD